MRYGLLLFAVCMYMLPGGGRAFSPSDCNIVSPLSQEGYATDVVEEFAARGQPLLFFTDDDLQLVLRHTKQYCCRDGGLIAEDTCPDYTGPYYYAQSPLLGDHILNIGMRKMDGVDEACNTMGYSCSNRQLVPDIARERRELITKIAEDREGYPSAQIEEYFKKYRGERETNSLAFNAIYDQEREKVDTLWTQYHLLCEEMDAILTRGSSALSEGINYTLASNGQDFATHCKTLATRRYEQEVKYVRTLMVEKGVTHLVRNLRAYSLNYLIGNRMNDLADKYNELEGCYSSVLRYTTNTACCNE